MTTAMNATATVTISADRLHRLLHAALLFTAEDDNPNVRAVLLETELGRLTATATDRYTLAHVRQEATGSWNVGTAVIDRDHAEAICAAIEPQCDEERLLELSLAYGGQMLRLTCADEMVLLFKNRTRRDGDGQPYEWNKRSGWINYRKLFAKVDGRAPGLVEPIGLNPGILGRFGDVAGLFPDLPARWTFTGSLEPVRVDVGDEFTGLVMPYRLRPEDHRVNFFAPMGSSS